MRICFVAVLGVVLAFAGCSCPNVPPVVAPAIREPGPELIVGGEIVPGRISVELGPELWRREFAMAANDEDGLERLVPGTPLVDLLLCHRVERVWRRFAELERRSGDTVRVVGYREWYASFHAARPKRANQQPYEVPELPEAADAFDLDFPDRTRLDAVVEALKGVPGVRDASIVRRPRVAFTPNDPGWLAKGTAGFDKSLALGRWGFDHTGEALGPLSLEGFDINAPEAWNLQRGSPAIVVAVVDSEIDVAHEDLYLNIYLNNGEVPKAIVDAHRGASADDGLPETLTFYDLNVPAVRAELFAAHPDMNGNGRVDGEDALEWWSNGDDADGNGRKDDLIGWNFVNDNNQTFAPATNCLTGHGTCVAGLIAAVADNKTGVAGVAHRVRILPVTNALTIAEVVYALSFSEVRVISQSTSSNWKEPDKSTGPILETLEPEGVLYVASLGNVDNFSYGADPSRHEQVVSVSNFGPQGHRSQLGGSSYGPKTDVAAPGEGLWSLKPGGGTSPFGGTSAAAPMVAGVAALVASHSPTLSPEQIRQVLRMTAHDPPAVSGDNGENTPGWDLFSGWGLVDAHAALLSLNGSARPRANILSRPVNFSSWWINNDELAIGTGLVPIRAIAGVPNGKEVQWTLRRWTSFDMTSPPAFEVNGKTGPLDGTEDLAVIDTDLLDGRQVLELEVNADGVIARDIAVIDLPRAYISNISPEQFLFLNPEIYGFAYGPGFKQYWLQVAPGWTPADSEFAGVSTDTTPQEPPLSTILGTIDLAALPIELPADGRFTIRVRTEGARTWTHDVHVVTDVTHPPERAGFPVTGFYNSIPSPTAVDLDGDGQKEIVAVGSDGDGIVKVIRADGTVPEPWPLVLPPGAYQAPAVGDVTGDGRLDIVLRGTSGQNMDTIHVVRNDGTPVTAGFPVSFENPAGIFSALSQLNPPVLADVSRDGVLDILVSIDRSMSVATPRVRAIDGAGSTIREFATTAEYERIGPPAAGDIDGDGSIEIAACARKTAAPTHAMLYVWRADGTVLWTAEVDDHGFGFGNGNYGPILADIDGDDFLELAVASYQYPVRIFDHDGKPLAKSKGNTSQARLIAVQFRPEAVPAEMNVLFGTLLTISNTPSTVVQAVNLPDWEVVFGPEYPVAEPIAADLRGDAEIEIAYGHAPPTPDVKNLIQLALATRSGELVDDGGQWPLRLGGGIKATPLVADLDGDGKPELVVQCSTPDERIHVFDLDVSTHPGWIAWGEFRHDPKRTANYHADLQILSPSTKRSETVGPVDPALQGALVVRTRFSRGAPAGDTNASAWTVRIGGLAANVREVSRVLGEHWLVVDPIAQSMPGAKMLYVAFNDGGIRTWDSYAGAVVYEAAAPGHSTVAVIDKSGSMLDDGKIEAARIAARFFAGSAYPNDQVGVVAFNDVSENRLAPATLLAAGPNRDTIAAAITSIDGGGDTSIGAGLTRALEQLGAQANPANQWSIVLLSDGLENNAPFWEKPGPLPPVHPIVPAGLPIHTVALGPDADQALLQDIADSTGGEFYPVALGHSLSMVNRLADAYHFARERTDRSERLFTFGDTLAPERPWSDRVLVPAGARRLQFALNQDRAGRIHFRIDRPDGTRVNPGDAGVVLTYGPTSMVYTIAAPAAGEWRVSLTNYTGHDIETLLAVSAAIPLRVRAVWLPRLLRGEPVETLAAYASDAQGVVRHATFTALVTRPDKSTFEVVLHDNGQGFFLGDVPMAMPGSYLVSLQANGTGASGAFELTQMTGRFAADAAEIPTDCDLAKISH